MVSCPSPTSGPVLRLRRSVLHRVVGDRTAPVAPLGEVEGGVGAVAGEQLEVRGRNRGISLCASFYEGGWAAGPCMGGWES